MISEVPANCTVVGIPGRVVKRDQIKLPQEELDQIHLPDPVMDDIDQLKHENTALTNTVIELKKELAEIEKALGSLTDASDV